MSEKILKIVAPTIAVLTLAWGVLQYRSTTNNEFRKRFWEEQFKLYQAITNEAAAIASANRPQDVEKERKRFWILYWGKVPMIEHPEVKEALEEFAKTLKKIEDNEYQLLFTTDLKFSNQLSSEEIPSGLRQEFEEKNILLSDYIAVSVDAINSRRWWIRDEENIQTYVIEESSEQLKIYEFPSRDDLEELVYQLALACRSSLNKTWNPVDMELLEK